MAAASETAGAMSRTDIIEGILRDGGATIGPHPEHSGFEGCSFKISCGDATVHAHHGCKTKVSPLLEMTKQIFRNLSEIDSITIHAGRWIVPVNPFDSSCIVSAWMAVGRDDTYEGEIRTQAAWICPEWAKNMRGQIIDFESVSLQNASDVVSGCSSNCSSQDNTLFGGQCELNKALRDLVGFSLVRAKVT